MENWDSTKDVPYRIRLGALSQWSGTIRKDPMDKSCIVVASLNCNSPKDDEFDTRKATVAALKYHDPDLLFFAGDQNYTHDEATYGWLQFGMQFREVMKDRPTVCIPDDHDVGHGNLWGESGKAASGLLHGASDGGYLYPPSFVNMVERQQTWNLPDAHDSTPVQQGIGVYYTDINIGGVSFAILEDRKFKSAPKGKVPQLGPRPDHIVDPSVDPSQIDLPGLTLLGDRQLSFLRAWGMDWRRTKMKVVLSQTAFCGAVHLHGKKNNRLVADLDSNGWPQKGRNEALRALRRVRATHLCGDQHLAVTVKHGIDNFRDGPYAFTAPATVNGAYGRWWHPLDEQPGGGDPIGGLNPWVGDYYDGFGNPITMLAYANPKNRLVREEKADGYGIVRFYKSSGNTRFECWPRFSNPRDGDAAQFPGWPMTFHQSENDGRTPVAHLPQVRLAEGDPVVEVVNLDSGELIYCHRVNGGLYEAPVYAPGRYRLRTGLDRPEVVVLESVMVEAAVVGEFK